MKNKHHLLLLVFAVLMAKASATSGFSIEHDHDLNILGGSDGTIVVQSRIVNLLESKSDRVTDLIQSMTKKYGVWIESKDDAGKLRYRLSKTDNKNRLKIEYDRTKTLADGRSLKFSGITYIDISEE